MISGALTKDGGVPHFSPPRLLIIGAGARGNAYARAVTESTSGVVVSVAEPVQFKREALGKKYIWRDNPRQEDQEFNGWEEYLQYELSRRERERAGERVLPGIDGVFVCTLDQQHADIVTGLAPLGLHMMSEKPLATTLDDCLRIYRSLCPAEPTQPTAIFSVGHVLRYSPHNMLLRKLVLEDGVIGDIVSIEHTEPVGWWHFSHSFVRGNWRKESTTAPSLLTKSCHDIDIILWLLSSPASSRDHPHLPSYVSSLGSRSYFRKSRKPTAAGNATNCLSCPAESSCIYSAKKIYLQKHLDKGITGWPVDIVLADIEDYLETGGMAGAKLELTAKLSEDYDESVSREEIDGRTWYGRCVYEASNDVCDDQVVTMSWEEQDPNIPNGLATRRGAKTASFHMVALTERQCERRGRIYGTQGEIEYDSRCIQVHQFANQETTKYHPEQLGGGHGGGDAGLAAQYVKAINAVKNEGSPVDEAQKEHIGCTLQDVIRSHAVVFAAEEARREKKVIDWKAWWNKQVESKVF